MRSAWALVALAACGDPSLADAVGSVATSDGPSTTALTSTGEPTVATNTAATSSATTSETGASETGASETGASDTGAIDGSCVPGELRDCFTGPPEAAEVSPCHAGTQTCINPGTWGGCLNEVSPTQQDCATPEDETCSGAPVACAGGQGWVRVFPMSGGAWGAPIDVAAIAIAADGDIIATGLYGGTIEFGGQKIKAIGELDVWVARFGPDGAPQWFRRFGGPDPTPGEDYAGANWGVGNIAFDPGGDILITSKCIDTIDFGLGPLTGEPLEPIALRMTSVGDVKWAHRYGLDPHATDYPLFIAPAGGGDVWLAGTVGGAGIDLGGGELHSAGWGDVLLAKFDADGEHLWSRRAGDPGHQGIISIAAAPAGGLVIVGSLEGSLDLGDGPITSAGTSDAFVARLDADGHPLWARRYGDNFAQSSSEVRVDGDGTVLFAGHFESTIDLGGGPFVSTMVEDEPYPGHTWFSALFFAQLTAAGAHMWSSALLVGPMKGWESTAWLDTFDRAADGTLVLAGGGQGPLVFPGDVWGSGGGPWVATLGLDGSPGWQHILTDGDYSVARAAAGPTGEAIVAMDIYGEVEFGGVKLGVADQTSLVLAQFGP